ncbi:MAG: ribonuclease HII [Bryobacterales bacterium]|nr:ribonuclease HII [Bryobacterales bacterium]
MACTSHYERQALESGYQLIAGLDEAGRGCLFGPVYAAAVILDPARPIRGLNDSKQLTAEKREDLAVRIRERAIAWAVASVDAAVIDRINIYQASRLAMRLALERLSPQPDYLLIDALRVDTLIPQMPLIHGDARCRSIAAASILAKVDRDASMAAWHEMYPEYGFLEHKGYSTPQHLEALTLHGATKHHRYSYEPVRLVSDAGAQLTLFVEV